VIFKYPFVLLLFFIGAIFFTNPGYGQPKTYYVATDGNNSATGLDINLPLATISMAMTKIVPGDTIYVRGGTFVCTAQITISSNGIDTLMRSCLLAYPGERPLLDFSSMGTPRVSGSADGIRLTGKYWYIKGLDIKGAPHNGIQINGGSYNIIEFCSMYENRNTGMQLSNLASYNRMINCDAFYNRDSSSASSYDGNADGFSPKLDNGTLNYFYGCRSWQNSDDGWDGYVRPSAPVAGKDTMKTIIENCWCFSNGYLKSGTAGTGNGNGFKMGGGDKVNGVSNGDSLRHTMILINCLSFNNLAKGFDQNNNRGSMTLINCTGYANGTYNFSVPGFMRVGETLTVKNCISFASSGVNLGGVPNADVATNSWPDESTYPTSVTTATAADFISLDTAGVRGPRKPDGSLPDITYMHLVQGSHFIDAGTTLGLPFHGTAPDLGCFESDYPSDVDQAGALKIAGFSLFQNYPNPFNPLTVVRFSVARRSMVKLRIINLLGQEIATLFSRQAEPDKIQSVQFDASLLPSGIYFSVLETQGKREVKKMVFMK
jgi:hypothetical protein